MAADSPICIASGQTTGPCNIVIQKDFRLSLNNFVEIATGQIKVVVNQIVNNVPVPLSVTVASYPFTETSD